MTTIWGPGTVEYRFQQYRELESVLAQQQAGDLVPKRPDVPPIDFYDRQAGLRFLYRFRNDPIAIAQLRGLLYRHNLGADLCLLTPDEALSEMATLLYWGRVVVTEHVRTQLGVFNQDTQAAPAPASDSKAAPSPSPAAGPEDDAPTLPDNDGAKQAAALRDAAKSGVPFCEECAKAAAAAGAKN